MNRLKKIVVLSVSSNLKGYCRFILLAAASLLSSHATQAQFTIIDDLRGNNYPDIIVGGPGGTQGTAYFTSGIDDPVGSGWLRLTRDATNQRGFAYIDRSFPSGMGVLVDFEYKMWRSNSDGSYYGADGLSVFLFDAAVDFRLGGYGGSLGYAPNTVGGVQQGLAGGYIGVGLDAYGNFSNPTEGRVGQAGGAEQPNAVVLRGPTTNNQNTTNRFLAAELLGDRNGGLNTIRQRNEVDYNTITTTRPSGNQFYRRVQITIMPTENGNNIVYEIAVRWSRTPGGVFEDLISYTTTDPPPALMKVGFAASTGSGFNFHEIRNILVTTIGNLRTTKLADRDFLIPTNAGGAAENENKISYIIEVTNDTNAPIEGIALRDTIKDAYGNTLTDATFTIDDGGITVLDPHVLTVTSPIVESATNVLSGIVSIAAKETGRIRVRGTLHQTPPGNHLINTVKLHVPEGTDQDTLNNVSSVRTPVYADGVDLILGDVITDGRCINHVDGNTFTTQVSNMGTDDVNVSTNRITVTVTHPEGITLAPLNSRWTVLSNNPTTHVFRLNNPSVATLRRGFTHPDVIRFQMTPKVSTIPDLSTYKVIATVSQSIEGTQNGENNASEASVHNCAVTTNPMIRHRVKWWRQ